MLAYSAGVDHYQRRVLGSLGLLVSHLDSHSHKSLAVSLVLLTSKRQHEGATALTARERMLLVNLAYTLDIFFLLVDLLRAYRPVLNRHKIKIRLSPSIETQLAIITHYNTIL